MKPEPTAIDPAQLAYVTGGRLGGGGLFGGGLLRGLLGMGQQPGACPNGNCGGGAPAAAPQTGG